jgi:hypothetical protein
VSKLYPAQFGNAEQYRNPDTTLPTPKAAEIPRPLWTQPALPVTWRQVPPTGASLPGYVEPNQNLLPFSIISTYTWETPWYDLRPDLRSAFAQPKIGVPIWERNARLYVQLNGGQNSTGYATTGLTALAVQYFNTLSIDPGQVAIAAPGVNNNPNFVAYPPIIPPPIPNPAPQPFVFITGAVTPSIPLDNVTATFFPPTTGTLAASLGVFAPPGTAAGGGDGYPVRYWKLSLQFLYAQPMVLSNEGLIPDEDAPPPTLNLQAAYY